MIHVTHFPHLLSGQFLVPLQHDAEVRFVGAIESVMEVDYCVVLLHVLVEGQLQVPMGERGWSGMVRGRHNNTRHICVYVCVHVHVWIAVTHSNSL